ncbi:class I adenylate-forming enzyme family protein [Demequina lignilytica]|uniref:AMP-binding protein n=1 Tax=Demequina lignilytica TaxID=3051663 RepID=A0AB35ML37_9MICO|nr:AMP-binding protein [Demequina sp. SYSU T0a273]MDN4484493.1 AMP-binding protein [Demequina sp. SYSU T0a273]
MSGEHTLGRWLLDRAARSPERIAIDDRGLRVDYATLGGRAQALGDALTAAGYGPGDRIATICSSTADHVVAFFGCALAGVAFVPLSWRLTAEELAELVARTAPALVLSDDARDALAAEAVAGAAERGCAVRLVPAGSAGIEAHVPERPGAAAPREVRDEDPLLIVYTSGSEASPKGAILSHESCFWNNLALAQALPLRQDDVVLAMLPQFHVAAWNVQPLLAWWVGATVVLESSFQPSRILRLIAERGVTCTMGVPTQYRMLSEEPGWDQADLTSLRLCQVGGATAPLDLLERWASRGAPLTPGYGLTEAGPNVLCLPSGEQPERLGCVGRPYPGVTVRIVDPASGLELDGPGVGELQVQGPSVFSGYLGDAAASAAARDGGWLRTGDLAERGADGAFRIVDRLKDIFISGGENVAPAEVEAVLERHPLVAAAAVVGVPDPVWGERGVAYVEARAGAVLGADELAAHAAAHLAGFKVPVRFHLVPELPRTGSHKVHREVLRAQAVRESAEVRDERR